jgi:hypothetical protein
MKFKHLKAVGLIGLIGLTGCVDLTEKVVSGITSSYYETPDGLNAAVNAAYASLQDFYGQERNFTTLEYGVDIWAVGADGSNKWFNDYGPQLEPRAGIVKDQWDQLYRSINIANTAIGRAAEVPTSGSFSDATKATLVAEAKFIRAHDYFYLIRQYGDVTVTTEETKGVIVEATRTPVAQIYDQLIIPDLQAAIDVLPVSADPGRATKGAAQTLLSLVYLTRNGPGDAQKAEELGKAVINSGQYHLLPTYAEVFTLENEASPEVVFSIQSTNDPLTWGQGNRWHLYWRMVYDQEPGMKRDILYGRPFRRMRPSEFMLDSMFNRAADSRWDSMFQRVWYVNNPNASLGLALGDTAIFLPMVKTKDLDHKYCGKKYEIFTEPDDFDNPKSRPLGDACPNLKSEYNPTYFPTLEKWTDATRAAVNQEQSQRDFLVYRISDVYLMVAEALIRQGKGAEAVPFVNAVRVRAAKPGHEAEMMVDASKMTLDFLIDERGRELFAEGHRWFDLIRFGKFLELVEARNTDARKNLTASADPEHFLLRPIPQSQIDLTHNTDGTPYGQNPGY